MPDFSKKWGKKYDVYLECFVCKVTPGPFGSERNRYACIANSDHYICERCKIVNRKCGCGSRVQKTPSGLILTLLEDLPWHCKFSRVGCSELFEQHRLSKGQVKTVGYLHAYVHLHMNV